MAYFNLPPGCTPRTIEEAYGQPEAECAACGDDLAERDIRECWDCKGLFCAQCVTERHTPQGTEYVCADCADYEPAHCECENRLRMCPRCFQKIEADTTEAA